MQHARAFLAGTLFASSLSVASCQDVSTDPAPDGIEAPAALPLEQAGMGRGLLVWETSRPPANRWRIWGRDLPQGEVRQISDGPVERDHYAPHLSPDGRFLLYSTYPHDHNGYEPPREGVDTPLVLHDLRSGISRELVPSAKAYWEHRCALWLDEHRVAYIAPDNSTRSIDIRTGEGRVLIPREGNVPSRADAAGYGYFPNPTLTHATCGYPTFSPLQDGRVKEKHIRFGCQPYFTYDGRWGYWMSGVGGPISRFDLETRQESSILARFDPRLPDQEWGYLYFPMVSRCGRAFAFGASRGGHNHWTEDYEIFLVPFEGERLEIAGTPRRMSHWKGPDRFPDVHLEPLELGSLFGEGRTAFPIAVPDGAKLRINSTGIPITTSPVEVVFSAPGLYLLEATGHAGTTYGEVRIAPPKPPAVLLASASPEGEVRIHFDEPVTVAPGASAEIAGRRVELSSSSRTSEKTLVFALAGGLPEGATEVVLRGISDTAQQPNLFPATPVPLQIGGWPSRAIAGWRFAWQDGRTEIEGIRSGALRLLRSAFYEDRFWLRTWEGGVQFDGIAPQIAKAVGESGQLYAEVLVEPAITPSERMEGILTLAGPGGVQFLLSQQGTRLYAKVGTSGGLARDPRIDPTAPLLAEPNGPLVGNLVPGVPVHLALCFDGSRFSVFFDGERVFETDRFKGDLLTLEKAWLCAGFRGGKSPGWNGSLAGIAIADRAPSDAQIAVQARLAHSLLVGQGTERSSTRVRARLVLKAQSTHPTLAQINPYREGLVVGEATVAEILEGTIEGLEVGGTIRIAQWAILDGKPVRPRLDAAGQTLEVALAPFLSQPQLKATAAGDTLEPDFSVPYLYVLPERSGAP